ncbi:MAG TPA: dihydrodipicolinate synthase family protein, partial [Candidatus Limnocylindrales bacterium]
MGDISALRGVWNIVPTPFLPDGSLDLASIPGLVRFVRGTGVDGLTILGVLGEAGRLADAERSAVLGGVLEAAAGSIPVCVGVSHAATDRAIAFAREAQAAGAHSVMLAPPPLARPSDAALRRHYLAVAESVDLPIVVQDHPASSGVPMSVEFLLALAA